MHAKPNSMALTETTESFLFYPNSIPETFNWFVRHQCFKLFLPIVGASSAMCMPLFLPAHTWTIYTGEKVSWLETLNPNSRNLTLLFDFRSASTRSGFCNLTQYADHVPQGNEEIVSRVKDYNIPYKHDKQRSKQAQESLVIHLTL